MQKKSYNMSNINISSMYMNNTQSMSSQAAQASQESAKASSQDEHEDFQKKMKKNDEPDKSSKKSSEKKDGNVLSSLLSLRARQDSTIFEHATKTNSSQAMQNNIDTIQQLSEKILVSVAKADGSKEVHVHVKNDLLPNTEVRLQLDGQNLHVNIVCTDTQTSNFLSQHAGSLQSILAEKQQGAVTVNVNADTNQDNSDGRSRQQRNIYEEQQNKHD